MLENLKKQSTQGSGAGRPLFPILGWVVFLGVFTGGCSVRKIAVKNLGDALAGSGSVFASEDDPELVREALPFSLKLMESLLAESPNHPGLLFAASSGFTQYAYAFIQQEADEMESRNLEAATAMRLRARRLYLRARDYGMRGLEARQKGFEQLLRINARSAVQLSIRADVPLLYWTAASWGAAISLSKDEPALVAEQPMVEALIDRALQLDESFDQGAIHNFLISYEMVRQGAPGVPAERARKHFERAVELSGGLQAGPFVALAEAVALDRQDRKEFEALLHRAVGVDVNAKKEWRLVNLIMQRRARWLLSRVDELILEAAK
jgi:predicted anti-sigma-YlaC factor YlaD